MSVSSTTQSALPEMHPDSLRELAQRQRSERRVAKPLSPAVKTTVPIKASTVSKPKQKLNPGMFYVLRPDGKIAYQCQKKKSELVKAYLERLLPSNSYRHSSAGFQLTQSLEFLGFKNPQEFAKACAAVCRSDTRAQEAIHLTTN